MTSSFIQPLPDGFFAVFDPVAGHSHVLAPEAFALIEEFIELRRQGLSRDRLLDRLQGELGNDLAAMADSRMHLAAWVDLAVHLHG